MEIYNKEIVDKLIQLNPFNNVISPIKLRACVGNNSGVNVYSRDCSISCDFFTPDYDINKICYKFINGNMRNSFEKCGQKTYLQWFDKHMKDII